MLLTISDFAKVKGLSRQRVSKAVQMGKLEGAVHYEGKKKLIDKELGLQLWDQTTPITHQVAIPTQTKKELKKQVEETPDDEIPNFNVSRARKEHWQASLAKLQVEQQKKELIPVTDLKIKLAKMHMGLRDSLKAIPDRVAPILAAETEQAKVHTLLLNEISGVLEGLSVSTN